MSGTKDTGVLHTTLKDLPSNFRLYDVDECDIRPFTAGEVRKLGVILGGDSKSFREELTELVDNTVSLDVSNIIRGDLWYILAWLRINTFRNAPLNFKWTCPAGHDNVSPVVLTELEIKELEPEFKEPAFLKLGSKEEIPLRLPRVGDEVTAVQYLKAMIPDGKWGLDQRKLVDIACTVDNDKSLHENVELLQSIEETLTGAEDLFMIENFQFTYAPGLKDVVTAKCGSCDHESEVSLPLRFRDLLPYGAYTDIIRSSIRFGEESSGSEDK